MSKNEPPKGEKAKPLTDEEYLQNLRSSAVMLEQDLARTNEKIHRIEAVDKCESCATPGQKGKICTACLGPTTKPPKSEQ